MSVVDGRQPRGALFVGHSGHAQAMFNFYEQDGGLDLAHVWSMNCGVHFHSFGILRVLTEHMPDLQLAWGRVSAPCIPVDNFGRQSSLRSVTALFTVVLQGHLGPPAGVLSWFGGACRILRERRDLIHGGTRCSRRPTVVPSTVVPEYP